MNNSERLAVDYLRIRQFRTCFTKFAANMEKRSIYGINALFSRNLSRGLRNRYGIRFPSDEEDGETRLWEMDEMGHLFTLVFRQRITIWSLNFCQV